MKERVLAQVSELVDPALRVSHRSYIVDFAQLHAELTAIQPLEIREALWINENTHPDDILRATEQVLARVEPLFDEAARRLEQGFSPPPVWTREAWYRSVGTSKELHEREVQRQAEREEAERKLRAELYNRLHQPAVVERI